MTPLRLSALAAALPLLAAPARAACPTGSTQYGNFCCDAARRCVPIAADGAADKKEEAKPADPALGAAIDALFPGAEFKAGRAAVAYLAKDKADSDELIAAAKGVNAEKVYRKWEDLASQKCAAHLGDPSKDPAFAAHLKDRGVAEKDLLKFYCPRRPAPGAASAKPAAMDQLKTAETLGVGAAGAGSPDAVKGASALSPAETLEARCGGAKAAAAVAPSTPTVSGAGLAVKEPPAVTTPKADKAPDAAAKDGEAKDEGKGGDAKKKGGKVTLEGVANVVGTTLMGAGAGAALGVALMPLIGGWGLLVGAIVGAIVGLLVALFG